MEGPSKAEITCKDNKDGTCTVSYLPTAPGDYSIIVRFDDKHIPGSPFTAKITGEVHIQVYAPVSSRLDRDCWGEGEHLEINVRMGKKHLTIPCFKRHDHQPSLHSELQDTEKPCLEKSNQIQLAKWY